LTLAIVQISVNGVWHKKIDISMRERRTEGRRIIREMRNLCKRDISLGLIVGQNDPFATLDQLKIQLSVPFFMDIIIVMSWCI